MKETIKYRERHFIDKFRCIDYERQVTLYKTWIQGSLLYGYKDRFNIVTIALDDIIERQVL